ncbi:hypothetical protein L1987_40842 [Smallanthus sonchifolius]|uniref:Uncharacterized protein n=1 Tax=Smallanthus sonchifolius TaxID=185202 RepID=A0ACB9GUR3_9ASTR|nr:hypothetical protein L1987_40842 [Smallanthus sonchifolius]
MAASVQCRLEEMSSGDTKEKETSDDLSLFVDYSGANLNLDLLQKSNQIHVTFDSESEDPLKPKTVSIIHGQDSGSDDLLNSLNNITDYAWLLSPRCHVVPSSEMEEHITLTDHILISNGQSTSPKSKLENNPADGTSTTNISPKFPASSSNGVKSSSTIRRPSPSRKAPPTGSRSATPTTRPTLTKPLISSTPTSRATVTAATKPGAPIKRSTTPTPRPPVLAVASKSTSRSSTPLQRPSILPVATKSTSRSSTPVQRPSIIANAKSASRSSTPTQRPSKPSGVLTTSAYGNRSSSVMKSRPSKNPPEMLDRSASASRVRPGPPTVKLPVIEMNLKAVPKRTSCSPSRGHGVVKSGITRGRGHSNGDDDVNPVLMGTQMVERVVNMRKLAPPRHDDISNQNNKSGKLSVSQDNSGFGRSLSKKSFDMALRHLDIRRSMPGNMRASITKVPASSVYSVRPDSTKTRTKSASDSPLATSSSAGSDQ